MSHSITLTWSPAENDITEMAAYTIMRSIDGADFEELITCAVVRDFLGSIIEIEHCTTVTVPTDATKQTFRDAPVSYIDTGLTLGHTYCYYLFAIPLGNNQSRGQGPNSLPSNTICVTVQASATPVVLSGQVVNNDSIVLTWTASTIEDSTIAGYQVWKDIDGGNFTLLHTTDGVTLTLEDDDVVVNHVYGYFVVAVPTVGGNSPPSNIVDLALAIFFTSHIYPVLVIESFSTGGAQLDSNFYQIPADTLKVAGSFLAGDLEPGLFSYINGLPESLKTGGDFLAGDLELGLLSYTNGLPEGLKSGGDFLAGDLEPGLIQYINWPAEPLKAGGDFIAGTLT